MKIGIAPLYTGTLSSGAPRQQPGTAIYNRPMTLREARQALAAG